MNLNLSVVKQGVILAAGRGSRMVPLSADYPKPLLPVLNKPVMQYQIEAMHNCGVDDIVVVIGHLGDKIREYFGNGRRFGVRLQYIVDRKPEGIASSLLKTKKVIREPFVLFLGDIFLDKIDLRSALLKFREKKASGVVIAIKEESFEAVKPNFEIITDPNKLILKVVEKPKNPRSLVKGIGVYLFSPKIFGAIERTGRTPLRGEYEITDSIQTLIDEVGSVYCQLWDSWESNISYPVDLLNCNLKMLKEKKLKSLVGHGAQIGKGARIISSIVGDRAIVEDHVVLEECLVFADTKVSKHKEPLKRMIFAKDLVLST